MPRRKPGSESAGYHYPATPKNPKPTRTPVVAPKPSEAARGPAGDYAGAEADYTQAVQALPAKAQAVTEAATRRATRRATAAKRTAKRQRRALRLTKAPKQREIKQPALKKYESDPSKAVIAAAPHPLSKPQAFKGLKTAGTPTLKSLQEADKAGTLKVNAKGFATTPQVRTAAKKVKQAKALVARSQPSVKGLSPEERAVVPLARKAHRKHPDVPASVLMSLTRQESGFNPAAVSSANAQGLTQFIPSTAASYGVRYGTGPKEKQSQETGAAKLLSDSGFASNPKGALTAYTGGYSDAEYNDPVLQGAADYKALDKKGNPKARRRLVAAKAKAEKLGLKVGKTKPAGYPAKKAKKLKGAWAGSRTPVVKAIEGIDAFGFKRTPAENAAVGGATESDHLTTNTRSFAADIAPGIENAQTVAKRLGIKGWGPGTYERFTTPKYPGYSFQLLWEVEGHYDHVHVGAEWTGKDLPAGTYAGGAGLGGGGGTGAVGISGAAASSYAAATGQSVAQVAKKIKSKKLNPQQIYKKLEALGVGIGAGKNLGVGVSPTATSQPSRSGSVLADLERKYQVAA